MRRLGCPGKVTVRSAVDWDNLLRRQRQSYRTLLRTGPCRMAGGAAVKKEKEVRGRGEMVLGI